MQIVPRAAEHLSSAPDLETEYLNLPKPHLDPSIHHNTRELNNPTLNNPVCFHLYSLLRLGGESVAL